MRPSRSEFVTVRGLRYHLRCWGPDSGRPVFILHGFMDVSRTWQFVVDHLPDWRIIAPDWRGFGLSDWRPDTYWFPDYIADLDALVNHVAPEPDDQVDIIGHSMGSQVASLYAGVRNTRVRRLAVLDGFFVPDMAPDNAPLRLREWLSQLARETEQKTYASFAELAGRVAKRHPALDAEAADFVARSWGELRDDGRIHLLADPRHRDSGPMLFRAAEAMATWKHVTAPVLWLDAAQSSLKKWVSEEDRAKRQACFRRRVVKTLNAGHMLHFEAPRATGEALAEFFSALDEQMP